MSCADCPKPEDSVEQVRRVAGWRAWYKGGLEFTSSDCEWAVLPDDGVLIVVLYFEGGMPRRRIMHGSDYYYYAPQDDAYFDNNHSVNDIVTRYPGAQIKRGQWTSEAEMDRVHKASLGAQECP